MMNNNGGWNWGQPMPPKYEIIEANDENSVRQMRMAPNSKTFIMSKTQPLIWLAETDGVGTLSVRAFDLIPHQEQPPVDLNDLLQRVTKLEEMYVQQSDIKQSRKHATASSNTAG